MPLYDYNCPACGTFRAWRAMSEARDPAPCPDCERPVGRAMVTPGLALMAGNRRIAHQRNERSAHEPRLETRVAPSPGHGHHHHHGHGHHHHHKTGRPWMIGH